MHFGESLWTWGCGATKRKAVNVPPEPPVGVGMIRLWVDTGAWPMPHCRVAAPPTFSLSDVKGWLATGTWPAGAHFRASVEPSL